MTHRDLATLAIKLMGIYFLIVQIATMLWSIQQFAWIWPMASSERSLEPMEIGRSLMVLAAAGLLVLLGWLIVAKAGWLAERLVPHVSPVPSIEALGRALVVHLSLTVVGLLVLANGAAGLVDWAVRYAALLRATSANEMVIGALSRTSVYDATHPAVLTALGLLLALAPRRVAERLSLPS